MRFGNTSRERLATCHPLLRQVLEAAIATTDMDFTVLEGYRNEADQNEAFRRGRSQLRYPKSKHNHTDDGPCSLAVDIAPFWTRKPHIRWNRPEEFRWLAGYVMGVAVPILAGSGYAIRWGGDWDRDGDHHDSKFQDLPHLELVELPSTT